MSNTSSNSVFDRASLTPEVISTLYLGPSPPNVTRSQIVDQPSLVNPFYIPWDASITYDSRREISTVAPGPSGINVGIFWLLRSSEPIPSAAYAPEGPNGPMASPGDLRSAYALVDRMIAAFGAPRPVTKAAAGWAKGLFADAAAAAAAAADGVSKFEWEGIAKLVEGREFLPGTLGTAPAPATAAPAATPAPAARRIIGRSSVQSEGAASPAPAPVPVPVPAPAPVNDNSSSSQRQNRRSNRGRN